MKKGYNYQEQLGRDAIGILVWIAMCCVLVGVRNAIVSNQGIYPIQQEQLR